MTTVTFESTTRPKFVRRGLAIVSSHAGLMAVVGCHAAIAVGLGVAYQEPPNFQMLNFAGKATLIFVAAFIPMVSLVKLVHMAVHEKPVSPAKHFVSWFLEIGRDGSRLAAAALSVALYLTFISSFTYIKELIPLIQPFAWDQTFFDLDRAIFFGHDPWTLSFNVFGSPVATRALDWAYQFWFVLMYGSVFVAALLDRSDQRKYQFFYAFFLTWAIAGNLLATVLSSAGPVYFSRLGLGDQYAPLFEGLRTFSEKLPIVTLDVQDMLWTSYVTGTGPVAGISAMPSMHVSMSVLMALFAFRFHKIAGWALTAFAAVILVGSVHLGWHYLVDGLLGGAVTVACWYAASFLAGHDLARQKRQGVVGRPWRTIARWRNEGRDRPPPHLLLTCERERAGRVSTDNAPEAEHADA